ncbi:hypothetical protein [Microbacterium sp. p3-SID336]|uniref:hypothetical protein n=1 Tax=Microbacterium sp. p3-SID336 TaxID=2916212 RepID=UPI0021A5643D|nr:hypothetical protein [Microbacterium sp. p3-SID336]MCT1478075.1 hypothetical protein [Microbacterium sp. p3-SID336]
MSRRVRGFRVGAALPGAVLRLAVVAVTLVGALTLQPYPLWQGVAVAAAVVAAVLPQSLAAWVGAACLPFGVILSEPAPGRTALAVLLVHAIHVLGSLSLTVPALSWVALRVLVPTLGRFVVVQLVAQSVVLGAWALTQRSGDGGPWIAPVAAAGLLAGVLLLLRSLRGIDAGKAAAAPGVGGGKRP